MPLDALPGKTNVLTRDQWRDRRLQFYKVRQPLADVGPDTQPYLDSSCAADQLVVLSADAKRISERIALSESDMVGLRQKAAELDGSTGRLDPYPKMGASGAVGADVGPSGSKIFEGDELTYSNLTYKVTRTATYQEDDPVPIVGVSTGPSTNLDPGTELTWSAPRPGCYATAAVLEDQNGDGLIGGRDEETEDEYRQRLSDAMANPAADQNDARIRELIQDSRNHGVAVQRGFGYPDIFAGGSYAFTFTLKPAKPGANRRPTAEQLATVANYVMGKLSTDAFFPLALAATTTKVQIEIAFDPAATGWANVTPWPYSPGDGAPAANQMVIGTVTDATHFQIKVSSGSTYTNLGSPGTGTKLALWDGTNGKFVCKTVSTAVGSGPWAITCDTTNAASDISFTPSTGALVSPWSDNLSDIVAVVLDYMGTLGPGEQVASPIGGGMRQARTPAPSPKSYPHTIDSRIQSVIDDIESLVSATLIDATPSTPTIPGSPGVTAYILELADLALFDKP